jgi:hypothetical protein
VRANDPRQGSYRRGAKDRGEEPGRAHNTGGYLSGTGPGTGWELRCNLQGSCGAPVQLPGAFFDCCCGLDQVGDSARGASGNPVGTAWDDRCHPACLAGLPSSPSGHARLRTRGNKPRCSRALRSRGARSRLGQDPNSAPTGLGRRAFVLSRTQASGQPISAVAKANFSSASGFPRGRSLKFVGRGPRDRRGPRPPGTERHRPSGPDLLGSKGTPGPDGSLQGSLEQVNK